MNLQEYVVTYNLPVVLPVMALSTDQAKAIADTQCAAFPPGTEIRSVYRIDCVPPPGAQTPAPVTPRPRGNGPAPKGGGTPTAGRMVEPVFTQVVAA